MIVGAGLQDADNKQQAFINSDTRRSKIQTGDMGPPPSRASIKLCSCVVHYVILNWRLWCQITILLYVFTLKSKLEIKILINYWCPWSLRKQLTNISDTTTGFPAKWCLRNEHRNSMLMTCHFPDRVVLLIGRKFSQSESPPGPGQDVWNFCTCFSDVISQGNQWWRQEIFVGCFLRLLVLFSEK